MKIQRLNIFKDHHIVAQPRPTSVGYDEWLLSIALWMKFYNSPGKYRPELNEYFHMYQCQLHFAMFCATSAIDISWHHLNHPNLLLRSVYRFLVYFHVRIILYHLVISLSHKDGFSKVKNSYIKSACYSICNAYGVNADEIWIIGISFMRQIMVFLVMEESPQKDLHQTILHDG